MSEYRLLVKDEQGIWQTADMGNDHPAMNYQVNNIAELKARQASYSQALRLPRSKRNKKIFGFADVFDVVTKRPYRRIECRLFYGDYELAGRGAVLEILRVVPGYFETTIQYGNMSFFLLLQSSLMADVDLGVFTVDSKRFNPESWGAAYSLALSTFMARESYPYATAQYMQNVGSIYPFVKFSSVVDAIMAASGYTLQTNIDYSDYWLSLADVSVSDDVTRDNIKAVVSSVRRVLWPEYPSPDELRPIYGCIWTVYSDPSELIGLGGGGDQRGITAVYVMSVNGDVKINLQWNGGLVNQGYFDILRSGTQVISYRVPSDQQQFSLDFTLTGLNINDYIEIRLVTSKQSSDFQESFVTFEVIKASPNNAGADLNLSERLGFSTQLDFMLFFARLYGLTFETDEVNRIVYAFSFDLLYDNIKSGNVYDWSNKVYDGEEEEEVAFSISGYGQKNIIKLQDNSGDNYTDEGFFLIDNETLDNEKELFSLTAEAGLDIDTIYPDPFGTPTERMANVPLLELKEENTIPINDQLASVSFKKIKPHLVRLSGSKLVTVQASPALSYNYPVATHVPGQEIVDTWYLSLANGMLKNAVILEEVFKLDPADMEKFDHKKPVYIQKYGRYFYVNKIKNFIAGRLTECELIRL